MGATAAKSEQLGMPIGTANARLRKMVLFDVLRRHGENVCCRCGEKIESVMELSLEHKKPWLHVSADLFWDLDNIGFSHTRCNQPHTRGRGGKRLRKVGPPGTAWCSVHKDFLPLDRFWKKNGRWNGTYPCCIECYNRTQKGA